MSALFYVYQYLRHDLTPYYIGKGKGNRMYKKEGHKLPENPALIQLVAHRLFEHEAFMLEKKLIAFYGRKDIGTGILRNRTNGGEGVSGRIMSEKSRRAFIKSNKNRAGRKLSKETKIKMSISKLGNTNSVGRTDTRGKNIGNTFAFGHSVSPKSRFRMGAGNRGKSWSLARRTAQENRKVGT